MEMHHPALGTFPMKGFFTEIVEPELIVFTSSALDEKGIPLFENLNTVRLAEEGGKTKLALHVKVVTVADMVRAAPMIEGQEEGWKQTLNRLVQFVGKN
jgi:uncharacterized protein YndB with AHSA1/START domain